MSPIDLNRIADLALSAHLASMRKAAPDYRPNAEYLDTQRKVLRDGARFWARVFRKGG